MNAIKTGTDDKSEAFATGGTGVAVLSVCETLYISSPIGSPEKESPRFLRSRCKNLASSAKEPLNDADVELITEE